MNYDSFISKRLGGKDFFKTSYYKFEWCNQQKKKYLLNHQDKLLDFGIGESNLMPDIQIIDELTKQAYVYENRVYADNGIEQFKDKAKVHMKEIYDVDCDKLNLKINHVMGAKSGLVILPFSFISKNDYVIYTIPGYSVLPTFAKWLEAKLYPIPLLKENNYLPDLDKIPDRIYKKTKIFIINYPNSPTGAIAIISFYEKLIKKALKYHFLIVNDCVYGTLCYKSKPISIFNAKDSNLCCIELHSLSKAFHMTGYRIGFVICNEKLMNIIKEVKDNMDSGQYIPIQYAAIKAYDIEKQAIKKANNYFYQRLVKIQKILTKYNLECEIPDSTFYLYVKAPKSFKTGKDFFKYLLDEGGIYTIFFDDVGPYVRFSMTYKEDKTFYKTLEDRLKKLTRLQE